MSRRVLLRACWASALTLASAGVSMGALAQGVPGAYQQYPGTSYPQTQYPTQPVAGAGGSGMRQLFAASLAAVVAASGAGAVTAVTAGLNGAITGWLDRKSRPKQMAYGQPAYGQGAYGSSYTSPGSTYPGTGAPDYSGYPGTQPSTGGYPATDANGQPAYPGSPGYPGSSSSVPGAYPGSTPAPAYPGDPSQSPYPPQTPSPYPGTPYPTYPGDTSQQPGGMPQAGAGTYPNTGAYPDGSQPYPGAQSYPGGVQPAPGSQPYPGTSTPIYAGVAYEIHLIGPGGTSTPVDPTSYVFRTGDRFNVLYRPSLPGRVEVYNVNAAGQTSQIDSVNVAAGQLSSLGPYEFADMTGNETLILQLAPCSTTALLAATRNIVKVSDGAMMGQPSLQLSSCSGTATRGLRTKTRDIRKVSVEQGTSFALDPLAASELSSGNVAPRQVTITLAHR